MATSAFKSTSRRSTTTVPDTSKPRRRSHSVSAVSRTSPTLHPQLDSLSSQFSNSIDNPLFGAPSYSPPAVIEDGKTIETASHRGRQLEDAGPTRIVNGSYSDREQRGRSVTRSAVGNKNGIGRSLSRARERSVSRDPSYGRAAYQNKEEQDAVASAASTNKISIKKIDNSVNKASSVRNWSHTRSPVKDVGVAPVRNQALNRLEDDSFCGLQMPNMDDGILSSYLSEAEEKTIRPVCEDLSGEKWSGVMQPNQIYETVQSEVRRAISDIQSDLERAFQRNNGHIVPAANVTDMSPDLADPAAVELITDIRREYAIKLEESEERARKLRADLAVEEHRGRELGRILKEIVPDPKSSAIQRSRRGRRVSNERRRMSKRLNEEAMAYFDECVSLSTFDSSDFSAPEDPLYGSTGSTLPSSSSCLVKGSPSTSHSYDQGSGPHQEQLLPYSCDNNTVPGPGSRFSFTSNTSSENTGPQDDIRSYIKIFERGTAKNSKATATATSHYYDAGEYNASRNFENMLVDRVINHSRVASGGMLLCGGALML